MRALFALVLLLGVGLAGFAVYMAQDYLAAMRAEVQRLQAEKAKLPAMAQVVVVTERRSYAERLTPDQVKPILWQADSLPEGAFRSVEELFPEGAEARYVLRAMEAHEPVLAVKVTEPGEDAGLTSRLGAGMRAFAIRVDVTSGVSGFLRPGDRVDVYWTGRLDGQGEVTRLIQSGIQLIAVDQIADTERTAPVVARTVTVEATPTQVAALAQAQSTGRLSLSLVGAEDDPVAELVQMDQATLLGLDTAAPQIAEEERVCTTRVRRGGEQTLVEIPCPE